LICEAFVVTSWYFRNVRFCDIWPACLSRNSQKYSHKVR